MLRVLPRLIIWKQPFGLVSRDSRLSWQSFTVAAPVKRYNSHLSEDRDPDDNALRQIFDSQPFWKAFSQQPISSILKSGKGLFRIRYLKNPSGFLQFARETQSRCQGIVDEVLQARSTQEYQKLPKLLDALSDSLCRVLDVSDFVSATHPDPRYQDAARQAYAILWEYMNVLNTMPGLNSQLCEAMANPEVSRLWSDEESIVAQILHKDFSNSAIDLPQDKRESFVKLSNDVKKRGHRFLENMASIRSHVDFESGQLKGIEPGLVAKYSVGQGMVSLPTIGEDAHLALSSAHDEKVRRQIYIHGRLAPEAQIEDLEALLTTRYEIAKLSGFDSYGAMFLTDKMAKSPEAVNSFLKALSGDNHLNVQDELRSLGLVSNDEPIEPWNVLYRRRLSDEKSRSRARKPDFMAAYFSLGTVMQGLSRLFTRLFGIRFVPRQTAAGETWTSDVRRLDVIHETEGHVAVLYCDLFARPGKAPNPAHFTLRCSRQIQENDLPSGLSDTDDDGMAIARSPSTGDLFQLPTIALVCDFSLPPSLGTPALLNFRDVQTLFHEMGHAIHSILGRTALQVVSGTRCPTDFAELPSVLMESFASDSAVLGLYARHWETDAPLPYSMIVEALESQKRWQFLQTETQILYSLVDQAYHSPLVQNMASSTDIFFDVYDRYSSIQEPKGTTPQAFFGHLVEYGGTYYSYLFDRAIAGKVWRDIFKGGQKGGAVDREAGERWKNEVLRWGGARDAWACVGGVLGDERLVGGGREAMEEVGKWGVHDT